MTTSSIPHKRRKAPECETCFRRRIKCDGQRPACRKCIVKGLQCPGVLDEFDLKFRDQSLAVKKKVQRKLSPATSPTQDDAGSNDMEQAYTSGQLVHMAMPTVRRSIHLPPGTFALTLFFDGHHNMLGSSGAADPWIAYMKPSVAKAEHMAPLRLAAEAMSLAVFGQHNQQQEATIMAMDKYAHCMSALRIAISDPVEAAADSTLMTVLLITMYEYITSNDREGKERFCHHADGVIALAVYRHKTGSVTHQQLQMFWVFITSMVMRYTYIGKSRTLPTNNTPLALRDSERRVTVPKQAKVRDWIAGLNAVTPDPSGRLFELMTGLIVLRTDSHDLHLPQPASNLRITNDVETLLASSLSMHQQLNRWSQQLPLDLRPHTHKTGHSSLFEDIESSEIWPGTLLTFTNLDAACTYNQWQSLQIVNLSVAIRNLHWLRIHTDNTDREMQYESLCSALYDHIDGICASVPYFLGLKHTEPAEAAAAGVQRSLLDGRGALSIAVMLQFCLLIEGIPSMQRRWLQGRLEYIAEHIGVRYATVGAKADLPCLIFEGDSQMLTTFGGKDGHALSSASLALRSSPG